MGAYGRSKTANILFAVEFDRRHKANGVRATAVHPGGIQTELCRHIGEEGIEKLIERSTPASPRALRPSATRVFRKAQQPRCGRASSPTPRPSEVAIARIAMLPRSLQFPACVQAYSLTRSIPNAHRRFGGRAKRWSASGSEQRREIAARPHWPIFPFIACSALPQPMLISSLCALRQPMMRPPPG